MNKCKNPEMKDLRGQNKELALLKVAVENTNEAFVTIDENHRVLFFNKAAERIFGYSRDEVLGHDLDVIMAPRCSRNHREAVERYIATRVPRRIGHDTEIVATRKNGETFPANISFSVAEVEGMLYFTGLVRDLTETKALQERIIKSERLAALGQVVAEITHEIKNPLMLIGGFARQLTKQVSEEKALEKLNVIVKEVSRLEDLLQEMRELYLPRTLHKEVFDVDALLQDVHELIKADCEKKGIKSVLEVNHEGARIEGDQAKLKQVFLNLVKNAVEAMEDGGNLRIDSQRTGDMVEITITDDGCGIPRENIEKIFAPFFTTKEKGSGLGLSISKSIIEDHPGSSFTLESEEGRGTRIKITMPVSRDERGAP
ncbi:MAG: PAS domain S-box protein [Proteobacteria bacterium]|nr:PAS domain S-box protein [Pseudomonadota bacterium]